MPDPAQAQDHAFKKDQRIRHRLDYASHHVAQSFHRESPERDRLGHLMAETPSIIRHPSGHMWGAAVRAAARHRFKFSLQCESGFKALLKAGLETHKVSLFEFTERRTEAQSNVEKLVRAMINAQLTKDPAVDVLDEWTIFHVFNEEKLCPGLWPIC
jgi:hypothetical protein